MKSIYFTLAATFCAGTLVMAAPAVIDGVKGVVSDQIVSFSEMEDYARPAADSLRRQYAAQPDVFQQKYNDTLNDSLEQLVERLLILHSFETDGYKLPDGFVDDLVQQRIHDRFGDRVTFMKTLQAQGLTLEQFRKQVRDQYIDAAMRNQNVQREIFVSPYKIKQYYLAHQTDFREEDQIKLRMIVLPKTGPDDTNTLKLAREIQTQIKEGASFIDMATTYSQGSQQHQGGDWGWVQRSVLRKELAEVAFTLKPGQRSGVIVTPTTCYIMLVEDLRQANVRPLAEVRSEVEKLLVTQEQTRLQKRYIDRLKTKSFIRYF